ncbi:uncharacterized protein EMH_0076170 [Eimeria mitis]|uniref:Uncharacterized protein n=1 Tax=Eimeria mitis TaxID=44415 RepID=U6KAS2_9EIME|nr:uncharacterized protein EMH_0076170 [Eimeria mitis]CDJ32588.1 hypothetical protein, conserved [Eimeria mitis]
MGSRRLFQASFVAFVLYFDSLPSSSFGFQLSVANETPSTGEEGLRSQPFLGTADAFKPPLSSNPSFLQKQLLKRLRRDKKKTPPVPDINSRVEKNLDLPFSAAADEKRSDPTVPQLPSECVPSGMRAPPSECSGIYGADWGLKGRGASGSLRRGGPSRGSVAVPQVSLSHGAEAGAGQPVLQRSGRGSTKVPISERRYAPQGEPTDPAAQATAEALLREMTISQTTGSWGGKPEVSPPEPETFDEARDRLQAMLGGQGTSSRGTLQRQREETPRTETSSGTLPRPRAGPPSHPFSSLDRWYPVGQPALQEPAQDWGGYGMPGVAAGRIRNPYLDTEEGTEGPQGPTQPAQRGPGGHEMPPPQPYPPTRSSTLPRPGTGPPPQRTSWAFMELIGG